MSQRDVYVYAGLTVLATGFIGYAFGLTAGQRTIDTQITAVYSSAQALVATHPDNYGIGDNTAALIDQEPPAMVVGNRLVNAYGGNVTITNDDRRVVVTFSGIPTDVCSRLAAEQPANRDRGEPQAISVNAVTQTIPIDATTAKRVCNKPGRGGVGGNSISFTISR